MFLANKINHYTFTNPFLELAYKNFGLHTDQHSTIIGDPYDFNKIASTQGITPESYRNRNKKDGVVELFYSSRMVAGKGLIYF